MSNDTKERRHANVANVREIDPLTREMGKRFGFSVRPLGMATGAQGIGCSYYEQPPGRTAFPRHYHCANEEALYILEGTAKVRIGDDTVAVGPGDYVTFPIGPASAHQIVNDGEETLRYLCLSTKHVVDVVGYPDSKKIGAMGWAPGSSFFDPPWVRGLFPEGEGVGYYDGEDVD